MDIDPEYDQSIWIDFNCESPHSLELEFQGVHRGNEFRLKGKKNDNNSISLSLRIADKGGKWLALIYSAQFSLYQSSSVRSSCLQWRPSEEYTNLFDPDSDAALAVAAEMVEQLELADHDLVFIAGFIDYLIMRILPNWRPSSDCHSTGERNAIGLTLMENQWGMSLADSLANFELDQHVSEYHKETQICVPYDAKHEESQGSVTSEVILEDISKKNVNIHRWVDYGCDASFGYSHDGIWLLL
ncbi:unnamed protein product [Fraxinus pennsylvanica]|uniref:non-specific serine/threonine protein kinase n=1 Tax=Fraxinus pennsylvanica TaxID=56036 RepID=A0AAD2DRY3_9LAMI|nr:unnamed protein product [Fraxinus pennsylvanica]